MAGCWRSHALQFSNDERQEQLRGNRRLPRLRQAKAPVSGGSRGIAGRILPAIPPAPHLPMSGLTGYESPSSSPSQRSSLMNCARTLMPLLPAPVTVPYTSTFCHT